MRHLVAVIVIAFLSSAPAFAECSFTNEGRAVCTTGSARVSHQVRAASDASGNGAQIIGGRPAGCPHAYCGCGLRKFLGIEDVRLNLAWNWAKLFPREPAPRPGLAAVRKGHVMYIEAAVGDGQFLIRDYNSGKGLSRLHVRDVRGYVFVNPSVRSAGSML